MTRANARLAVLVGASCAPFRDGVAAAVATPWDIVSISDDLSASSELIGRADAAIAISYSKAWPPAPSLRLLQVPGAGYDGIEIAAIPAGVTLCNVFEHEPASPNTCCSRCWNGAIGYAPRIARCGRASGPAPRASEALPMTSSPARQW